MLYWQVSEPSCAPAILGAVLQFSSTDLHRCVASRDESRKLKMYCLYLQQPPIEWVPGFPSGTKAAGAKSCPSPPLFGPPPPPLNMLSWRGQGQVYLFTSSNVHRLRLQEFRGKGCEANHSGISVPRL
jgi:hypothetical protein